MVFLVVVSNIMLYYSLNKPVALENILNDLAKVFSKIPQDALVNKVLVIKLESISEHSGDSLLPKLEYSSELSHPI